MAILWAVVGFILFSLFMLFNDSTRPEWPIAIIIGGLLLASLLLIVSMLLNTRYSIAGNRLLIRCGPLHYNIHIDSIVSINSHAKTPISGPRLSFDTMCIRYNKYDDVYISPKNKKALIDALIDRNPNIQLPDRAKKQSS